MLRPALLVVVCVASSSANADELIGNSVTLAAPVPREFRAEDPAYATWRQGQTFGYQLAVAPGHYRLELAFLEMIWRQPGQRVFDVIVDEKPLFLGVDLVKDAGRTPSRLVKSAEVEVGSVGLKILLRATADEASLAWLRLRDATGAIVRNIDCGGDQDLDPPSVDAPLSDQILPRFGSQALLELRPQFGDAILTATGRFAAEPGALAIGFDVDGVEYALPFARKLERYRPFSAVSESRTVTRLTYSVTAPGVAGTIEFAAPFHPGDLVGSGLPCFPISFRLERSAGSSAKSASVIVFLHSGTAGGREVDLPEEMGRGIVFRSRTASSQNALFETGAFLGRDALDRGARIEATPRGARIRIPIDLDAPPRSERVTLAVLRIGEMLRYLDAPYFAASAPSGARIESLVADFAKRRPLLEAASRIVDSLVEDATLPESLKSLLRVALPSFLMNTVLGKRADGAEYYACAEGYCRYHATLDVESHTTPFYFWFAPDLLKRALEQWAACVSDDGVMCHDLGKDGVHGTQHYPHAMPIEENTNFVLLLHAYVARTGDREFGDRFAPLVDRLLARVAASDTNGDGFADIDCANTIDDGSAAVQYSRGQTYLAMKTAVAYLAAADLLRQAAAPGLSGNGERIVEFERRGKSLGAALDARAWRDTHYALTIDSSAKGLLNPWTAGRADVVPAENANAGNPLGDVLEGADSSNGLVAIGAVFVLESFLELPLARDRLRLDLTTAGQRIARRFVLAHAEHEINGWVSLSVLRDAARTRLGDLTLDNCERYAALQLRRNKLDDRTDWAGFCDSPYNRYLAYYPRGVAALSLVDALAGVRFDRRTKQLELTPALAPLRIPLPQFANWSTLHVPWLAVMRGEDGAPRATLTEPDPFEGIDVTIDLSRVGGSRDMEALTGPEPRAVDYDALRTGTQKDAKHVVIVGGGFAGMYTALGLGDEAIDITVVDKKNHHLFQPLLYQVATAALAAPDIAAPIRKILERQRNTRVLLEDVLGVDLGAKRLKLARGSLGYDILVLAPGARDTYFGHDPWAKYAPGLKTIEDAFTIRGKILTAFESAEREVDPTRRTAELTFVIVGGGPTGVELAGSIAEIARRTLTRNFRSFDPSSARVILVEGGDRVLPSYPKELSQKAKEQLEKLGAEVRLNSSVEDVSSRGVKIGGEWLEARTVLWAAGVRASPLLATLGVPLDRQGRVIVEGDLSVPGHPEVLVLGDAAAVKFKDGFVPGVAPAAIQMGQYSARSIRARLRGESLAPFAYRDKGSLATIGRRAAVADLGRFRFSGAVAWLLWLFIHVFFLIGFRNRLAVMFDWAIAYCTYQRSARVILTEPPRSA